MNPFCMAYCFCRHHLWSGVTMLAMTPHLQPMILCRQVSTLNYFITLATARFHTPTLLVCPQHIHLCMLEHRIFLSVSHYL